MSKGEKAGSSEPVVGAPAAAEPAVSPTAEGPVVLATDNGRLTPEGEAIVAGDTSTHPDIAAFAAANDPKRPNNWQSIADIRGTQLGVSGHLEIIKTQNHLKEATTLDGHYYTWKLYEKTEKKDAKAEPVINICAACGPVNKKTAERIEVKITNLLYRMSENNPGDNNIRNLRGASIIPRSEFFKRHAIPCYEREDDDKEVTPRYGKKIPSKYPCDFYYVTLPMDTANAISKHQATIESNRRPSFLAKLNQPGSLSESIVRSREAGPGDISL